ncbi:hypothetical protein EI42_05926 [Thermosporothrix hazakensis]|uniref:Uncharacterized protein n=1 Tax=Thermosporothrix hazakensis TaxID=644383 RepID=A0A326TVA9_THEHA|nr:hypothetical protein EI42_05926 [Thermosporothrix hazakensis]
MITGLCFVALTYHSQFIHVNKLETITAPIRTHNAESTQNLQEFLLRSQ